MFGTYSTNLIDAEGISSEEALQIPSVTLWNHHQLTNQTTSGIVQNNDFFRSNDMQNLYSKKIILLLRFLSIMKNLPESALEEAVESLDEISAFYSNQTPEVSLKQIPMKPIKASLKTVQIRQPIVLEL